MENFGISNVYLSGFATSVNMNAWERKGHMSLQPNFWQSGKNYL
jgi:hypothetical protein